MFVDIRDFTPFAEANTAEDTVSHLNALFEIVVPAVLGTGGHINKYLGDGAIVLDRRKSPADIAPLVAVVGAYWALTKPTEEPFRSAYEDSDLEVV